MQPEPKIIPFEKWKEMNEIIKDIAEEKCEECDGDGITICCECQSEIECEYCDGDGYITEGLTRYSYKNRVTMDKELWKQCLIN